MNTNFAINVFDLLMKCVYFTKNQSFVDYRGLLYVYCNQYYSNPKMNINFVISVFDLLIKCVNFTKNQTFFIIAAYCMFTVYRTTVILK